MISITSSLLWLGGGYGIGVCMGMSLGVGQGGRAGHGKEGSEYGCTEEGATAVIKCPAGPWRGLPQPRAMLMSTPGGQGCLLSACWTIWWERHLCTWLTVLSRRRVIPLSGTHWIRIASLPFFHNLSIALSLLNLRFFFFLYIPTSIPFPLLITGNTNIKNIYIYIKHRCSTLIQLEVWELADIFPPPFTWNYTPSICEMLFFAGATWKLLQSLSPLGSWWNMTNKGMSKTWSLKQNVTQWSR